MGGSGWTIVEADSFATGAAACGGLNFIEEIIAPVKLGMSRNPKHFIATSRPGVRLAKTKTHWRGADIVLGYSVWFRVIDETLTIELLHVELTNPDAGDWGNDDEIPF